MRARRVRRCSSLSVERGARRRFVACLSLPGAGLGLAGLAGCSLGLDIDHDGAAAPQALAPSRVPRIAWVFGSGGPRGFTHVGFVKAMAELGLEPDLVVGGSVGALVGALVASRRSASEIEAIAMQVGPLELVRLSLFSSQRLSGSALADFARERVREAAGSTRIEDLPIPFACVASRERDRAIAWFNHGDVGLAVQASCAIEGSFEPVRIRGERYVDADLEMPLPVRVARSLGARRVVAVDASAHEDRAPPEAERFRDGDARKRRMVAVDARLADLVLHPDFGYWVSFSEAFRARAIAAGYRETMAAAVQLRALHAPAAAG